jgi:hypothetical protein
MAPNISKIDPDCYPNLGASPWYFRDEVLRMPFHPHSLSLLQSDRLIPVSGNFPPGLGRRAILVPPGEARLYLSGKPTSIHPVKIVASMAIMRGWGRVLIQLSSSRRVDPILPS